MASKKINCKVSKRLGREIDVFCITEKMKKGRALRHLVLLAIDNPDHAIEDFGEGEDTNCTLEMPDKMISAADNYRIKHALRNGNGFFKDALARGMSIHIKMKMTS